MRYFILTTVFFLILTCALAQNSTSNQQQQQNTVEFRNTLFNKGYIFSKTLDSIYTLKQGIIWTYNGDYNTLNIPITLKRRMNKNLSLYGGLQLTTITNSNNPDLPTNNFQHLDISLNTGGEFNFSETYEGYFSIQTHIKKLETDVNRYTPALQTSPINYNYGIKF
ncbi:MAG: hypothetical protein AAF688_12995 [Bacteroidota bacterium]